YFSTQPPDVPDDRASVTVRWDDPEILVVVGPEGEGYAWRVEPGAGKYFDPGTYTLRAKKGTEVVYQETFTLGPGEKREFGVALDPRNQGGPKIHVGIGGNPAAAPAARDVAEWERSVAKLSAEEQVKAVAAKLKELNPGFDGRVAFIQNDVFL